MVRATEWPQRVVCGEEALQRALRGGRTRQTRERAGDPHGGPRPQSQVGWPVAYDSWREQVPGTEAPGSALVREQGCGRKQRHLG